MAFRAFYALPVDNFSTSSGQYTNAVHGFTSMFLTLLENEKPTHVAVAFDLPGGTFRTQEYTEYKGGRDETPAPFKGQIELVQDVLTAMGVRWVTKENFEADDILATLTAQGLEQGMEVLVVSGDRDSFQLVTETSTVLYPIKGVTVMRRMTPEEVEERYGVRPELYPHLAALVGEKADNLPGVPGVGPKTAAKWLTQYGSLEEVLAHAEEIKGKAGQSLRDHVDDVLRNRRLNALVTDLDLGIDASADLGLPLTNRGELADIMDTLEFRSLHDRARSILTFSDTANHGEVDTSEDGPFAQLRSLDIQVLGSSLPDGELGTWLGAHASGLTGLHIDGLTAPGRGQARLIGLGTPESALAVELSLLKNDDAEALRAWLADEAAPKVLADAKGSWHALHGSDLPLAGVQDDMSLAGYLCRPEQRDYDVDSLLSRWLGVEMEALVPQEPVSDGFDLEALAAGTPSKDLLTAAYRAASLLPLREVLLEQMEQRQALGLYNDLELPVADALAEMEDAGIAVDAELLAERAAELDARVNAAASAAFEAAGHELNLSSPAQLQVVLFEELDMPKTRKTKRGYTTDAEALQKLFETTGHPFLENLLAHREAIKQRQMVETLAKTVQSDGRIHTTFQQTVAATGRLSSAEPNLQNIPARTEEGRRIREAFTVGEGYETLLTADYSQIEMRIMAHLSGDEALIEAFKSGEDLHRFVAAMVHNIPVSEVSSEQRSHVKAMSYGLAYGLSIYGLSRQLGISTGEAAELRDAYFARFGAVRDYLEGVVEQARRDGFTQTMWGRRRYLPDLTSDERQRREIAERAALNAPIQGSAADIVKKAMIDVVRALEEAQLNSRVLLQIHDELLLEVAPGECEQVQIIVEEHMAAAAQLSVPLSVGVGVGPNWMAAAH